MVLIAQDSFYRGLTPEEHDNVASYNFDHPEAIDVASLVSTLKSLLLRNTVEVPVYDFVTHRQERLLTTQSKPQLGSFNRSPPMCSTSFPSVKP